MGSWEGQGRAFDPVDTASVYHQRRDRILVISLNSALTELGEVPQCDGRESPDASSGLWQNAPPVGFPVSL